MSDRLIDLQTSVVAIAYYCYKQAGCPLGDNLAGFDAWHRANVVAPFESFAKREKG
jgi:hypothetical protein